MVLTTTILPPNVISNSSVAAIVAAQNAQNNSGFDFWTAFFVIVVVISLLVAFATYKGWIFKRRGQPQGVIGKYVDRPSDPGFDGTIEKEGVVYPIDPLRSSETIKDPTGKQKGKVSKIPTFKGGIEDYIEIPKEDFDIDRDKIDEILAGHIRLKVRNKQTIAQEVQMREFEYNALLNQLNYFQDLFKKLQGNPIAKEIVDEQIRGMHQRSVFRKENDRNLDVPRDAYGNPIVQPGQGGQK